MVKKLLGQTSQTKKTINMNASYLENKFGNPHIYQFKKIENLLYSKTKKQICFIWSFVTRKYYRCHSKPALQMIMTYDQFKRSEIDIP